MSASSYQKTSFKEYLQRKELTAKSILTYQQITNQFIQWTQKEQIEPEQVSYGDILTFMKHCQKQGITQRTIQHYLTVIKHYYEHLIEEESITTNPVSSIKVHGVKRKTLHHIFKPEELHTLYNSYQDPTLKGKRNKAMLSLLVYQGIKTEELEKLTIHDIKLREGKIEIPGGPKSAHRTLDLEPHQVLTLYEYVNHTRQEILTHTREHPDSHQDDKLFVTMEGGAGLSNCMTRLMFWVRRKNKLVKNAKQIRASVITKWLKQHNLRQVQYMAGHRYISSTEAYQQNEMEGLTDEVNRFHPLG